MKDEMPPALAAAFKSSKYYFSTQLGELVPLLAVTGVRTISKRRPTEKTDLVRGSRQADYYATLPSGCVAVAIAGRNRGKYPGELILQPGEIAAFASALKNLDL